MSEKEFDEEKEVARQKAHELLSDADHFVVLVSREVEGDDPEMVNLKGHQSIYAEVNIAAHMVDQLLLNKPEVKAALGEMKDGPAEAKD